MKLKLTKGDLLMASAAFAWAFSYIFMKWSLETGTPFQITFLRFIIGFTALMLIFNKKVIPTKTELKFSFVMGIFVFLLSFCYNAGLKTTDASTAGFLAGTTVAFVPILNAIIKRKMPEKKVLVCIVLCLGGLALMSLTTGFTIAFGSLLCIFGAIAYACQIIVTNRALDRCNAFTIVVWQLFFTALFSGIAMIAAGEGHFTFDTIGWIGVIGLGLGSSAYGYIAQTVAQKTVTPERIGFLYALEPVFCAIVAFLIFGDIMTTKEFIGALMILIGIVL